MNLIPQPKHIMIHSKCFHLDDKTTINIEKKGYAVRLANMLKEHALEELGFDLRIGHDKGIHFIKRDIESLYELHVNIDSIEIISAKEEGLFYGLQTLKQLMTLHKRHIPCMIIKDTPEFDTRGYYYDVTRGKVPTLDYLKKIVDTLSSFKINQLQLYVEHTFLYKNQSEVWTVTDPLTAEEIILLDQYCAERYVELVPSISTFGHLYEALESESYKHLSELDAKETFNWDDRMSHHTLNVSMDESTEFVQEMIDEFVPLVRSNKFNICADETFDLGEGKNKKLADKVGKSQLYVDFLCQIIDHVKSYDKEIMFWGDIIIKHPEHIDRLPKDLICLNWWYWLDYPEEKVEIIHKHGFKQYMCPGVNGWNTLMNDHELSYKNIKMMTDYGKKYDALGVLNTDWGDFGHWNSFSASIPGMIYGAAFSWGESRSYEELNESIDKLFYKSHVMGMLNELSKLHYFKLLPLVHFFEKKKRTYLDRIEVSYDELLDSNLRVKDLRKSLLDKLGEVPYNTREHIKSYILSADGILLFNKLYMVIKVEEDHLDWQIDFNYNDLAVELEYWLLDFKNKWYEDNKASELYRIVDFIKVVTKWLRTVKR